MSGSAGARRCIAGVGLSGAVILVGLFANRRRSSAGALKPDPAPVFLNVRFLTLICIPSSQISHCGCYATGMWSWACPWVIAHAHSASLCGVAGAVSLLHDLKERAFLVARDFLASLAQRGGKNRKSQSLMPR